MASLTGNLVAETYKALLKTIDNDILTASEKQITDGFGGGSNVFIDSNGFLRANKYKVTNGLATQFLKADGSLDANTYLTSINSSQIIAALGFTPVTNARTLTINGTTYDLSANRSWTIAGTSAVWGNITGTLSNQTDLQTALNAKFNNPTGTISQYIRGDGSIATFPTSGGGGGGGVSYYLNGSINQGTIGGVTYYEMNKVPIIGTGTDFSRNSNGYIASFLTDANDPALLQIPAGNWNFETYLQASNGGGSPSFYIELYKYDGTTFTLIASNSGTPKLINDGANIEAYFSALAVPQTTLTLTDRLAIRIYVNTAGRTITLHTENGHLCEVATTFSTGISALNGLTAQIQYLATGTSGTDFNISSSTATHTFNLPTASAVNRGALSAADWTTFNAKQAQLNGTGFVKASGTTISYDNSTYLTTADAASTYQLLTNLSTDLTASATKYPSVNAVIAGLATKQPLDADLTAIAALAGTTGFLIKTAADTWSLDTNTYLTTASAASTYLTQTTAASTYQRLDKMVSNLLASSTEYPNSNAVLAKLALKADAANPVFTGDLTISGATPRLYFVDTDQNPDYTIFVDAGYFYIYDQTAGATKFQITPSGNAINAGTLTSTSFIKSGGTASQFLMADGSVTTGVANPVGGTGTTNYLPKWTSASVLGNSNIYDNGTNIGIKTTNTYSPLNVQGTGVGWGENQTYFASPAGYITVAFWLQGATDFTGTWAIGKQSRTDAATVEYLQVAKNGLTGSTLHRADALQTWDPNGNSYFGFNVGIGTITPSAKLHAVNNTNGFVIKYAGGTTSEIFGGIFASTTAGFASIGTQSNHAFNIFTNDTDRLIVSAGGFVGIGTSGTPDARLHVQSASVSYGQIRFLNSTSSGEATIHIGRTNQTLEQRWTFGQGPAGIGDAFGFYTGGSVRLAITTAGTVGIGTTAPMTFGGFTNLTIASSTTTNQAALFLVNSNVSMRAAFYIDGINAARFGTATAHPLLFDTGDVERMRITSAGNVGIGVTNPQSQLHMNGDLTFTESGYNTARLHQITHSHSDGNSANNNLRFLVSDGSGSTAERMRINGLGNVGIGNSGLAALGKTLTVEGTIISQSGAGGGNYNENMRANRAGNNYSAIAMGGAYGSTSGTGVGQWTLVATPAGVNYNFEFDYAGATKVIFSTGGNVTAAAFFESSDNRLKKLIDGSAQIAGIENLKAKLYEKNGKIELGYFAQDAEKLMPYAVTKNADGFLSLSYREVHTAKIARLEKEVEMLKAQLNAA